MTIQKKAQKYIDQFQTVTRSDDSIAVILKDTRSQKLYEAVKQAHGDSMPSDFVFSTFLELLERITEYDIKNREGLEDLRSEIVASCVDIYTHDLTKWLNSDINNVYFLTEAIKNDVNDGFRLLSMAQYMAIDEVMDSVMNLF